MRSTPPSQPLTYLNSRGTQLENDRSKLDNSPYLTPHEQNTLSYLIGLTDFSISEGFNIFGTHTYRYQCSVKSVRRTMLTLFKKFKEYDTSFQMIWFAEPHRTGDSWHSHSLIKTFIRPKDLGAYWFKHYGYGTFKKIKKDLGAEYYCAKYVAKQGSDYDYYF